MITKDMLINEVLGSNPEAIEIMMNHGLQCIGCHAGAFESLEDGCKAHGMSEEEINEIVDEINGVKSDSLKISRETLVELKNALEGSKGLRIKVNGEEFDVSIVEKAEKDDVVLESPGVKVFIEKKSVEKLGGKRLGFKDGEFFIE